MIVGFTGTRNGLSITQWKVLANTITRLSIRPQLAVHGDCKGADASFHEEMQKAGVPIRIRPCDIKATRVHCKGAVETFPEEKPLDRNVKIVEDCHVLIACPGRMVEEQRSGTWHAVRSARKVKRPTIIIWPNGCIQVENGAGDLLAISES